MIVQIPFTWVRLMHFVPSDVFPIMLQIVGKQNVKIAALAVRHA